MTRLIGSGMAVLLVMVGATIGADDEVPAPFARFETMVGGWKGTARPATNKVRGWPETHSWAWKFAKGTPVGMTLNVEGGKVFTRGQLAYDDASRTYILDALDPAGKPIQYKGKPSTDGKGLVLDREGETPEGKERVTIRPNASGIRYTMMVDRQAPGAPQYKNAIEVGLTKEGESFAAGGAEANGPKCILTGGSATMTVTHNGKSYPVCCTGCRDEFNDNPEKYVARAEARAKADGDKPAAAVKPAAGSSSGEFDGLVDTPKSGAMPKSRSPGAKKDEASTPKATGVATKAERELRLGQAYEKAGKADAALKSYRGIIKDYPGTSAAKAAAARIEALDKP